MTAEIDTTNQYMVASRGDEIIILLPPRQRMTNEEALRFAAWLVALAEPFSDQKFEDVLKAVRST